MSVAMKEQKPAARPWRMLLPLAVVLALALAWSSYWAFAFRTARTEIAAQRQAWAVEGRQLACAAESWGGYPFRIEFTCERPALVMPGAGLRAARLRAVAMAYDPWHVLLLVDGPTQLDRGSAAPLDLEHGTAIASLRFAAAGATPAVSVQLPRLAVKGWYTADDVTIHTRPEADGATGLAVAATGSNYQPAGRPPLVVADARLQGRVTPDGLLRVDAIALQEGPVLFKGDGEVGLDDAHRLSGRLATETNDFEGLMSLLEPHLVMTPEQFAGLKTMLGLLARTGKVNIVARDGDLYVGPVRVAPLPPLY
jgi:hypothetical protein